MLVLVTLVLRESAQVNFEYVESLPWASLIELDHSYGFIPLEAGSDEYVVQGLISDKEVIAELVQGQYVESVSPAGQFGPMGP